VDQACGSAPAIIAARAQLCTVMYAPAGDAIPLTVITTGKFPLGVEAGN
jgi:hypothetical protein